MTDPTSLVKLNAEVEGGVPLEEAAVSVRLLSPDDAEYGEYLERPLRREFPSPVPRRRRRTTRRQAVHAEKTLRAILEFEEEIAAQLFVADDLLEIAGNQGVDREFLARKIVRTVRVDHGPGKDVVENPQEAEEEW